MTKADLVEAVYAQVAANSRFTKRDSAEVVELVFSQLKSTLADEGKIKISGFGNFLVRSKNARIGRNPQNSKEITIAARRVLSFKPSQVLKNALNS